MIPKTIIALTSGGLDSVTLLYDLVQQGHNVHPLMVDYHQPHVQELQFAKAHIKRLNLLSTTMTIPDLGRKGWIVPNRNMVLLSLAISLAVEAEADTVTIGCNADDREMFPDCRQGFIVMMGLTVLRAGYKIEVCAPYLDFPKKKIVELAKKFQIPLWETWSCYAGGQKPCNECPACKQRNQAINE